MRKKLRPMKLMVIVMTVMAGLSLAAGCGSSGDERLVVMAQKNIAEQSSQNERMAEQSIQIAEASKRLVIRRNCASTCFSFAAWLPAIGTGSSWGESDTKASPGRQERVV